MESKIYRIGPNGMEELSRTPELKRGQIVVALGGGLAMQLFAVADPAAKLLVEIREDDVNSVEDLPDDYFSATHHYGEHMEPYSKQFGIGFYWDDLGKFTPATEEEIAQGLKRAEDIVRWKAVRKQQEEEAFHAAQDEARKKYGGFLTELSGPYADRKEAANNLRKLLKHEFPTVKFSVRNWYSDVYFVSWVDGPTHEQVQKLANLFDVKERDKWNDDLWDDITTGFNSLYGHLDLSVQREISKEQQEKELERWKPLFNVSYEKCYERCELLNAAKGEIPEDIQDSILHNPYGGRMEQYVYSYLHSKDLTIAEKREKDAVSMAVEGLLEYFDYSEKAFAVTGDISGDNYDRLKSLGGKYNSHLKCGAGFIFSKRRESQVREALNI